MKITFVLGNSYGLSGGNRIIATYTEYLQRLGHDVLIVSRPPDSPSLKTRLRSFIKGQGWISQPKRELSHFDHITVPHKILERYRPVVDADVPESDVVIATWWETAEWVANLSPAKGAKAYFIQHHEVFDYLPQERARATYRLPLHKITISKWLLDIMQTDYGDSRVSFVPNSIDSHQFCAPPRGKQAVPTVGLLYNTTPWKGCDISLKAVSIAAQKIPNLHLVALSDFEPVPELPVPPGTEFMFRPAQETLKDIYAKCDVWLFGSRLEGFGLPILEAMACRTPVIGTPAGAAPELLAEGAGILVNPEAPQEMAEAIVKICQLSEAEWCTMSDTAYVRATGYTWDDATMKFEAALYTAIERTKQGDFSK